ncbi:MAG: sigma-70 family RNA polymerase sigma factor [Defluviitaleaceae bacterium]|nr:sigma-70 family RNA polymerase sigma factor [Defluviitaleaceae bacterium]
MDFNHFIAAYDGFIKMRSRSLARDASEADELHQKASIIMWQQYGRLSAMTPSAIKAFLSKSIKNALIDLRRREKRFTSYDAQPVETSSPRFENALVNNLEIMEVIHHLSPSEQDIIFKIYFMGMDSTEIGKQLNISPATVRSKRARAQQKLKKLMEREKETIT